MTYDQIEDEAERRMDRLDRRYLNSAMGEDEYREEVRAIDAWANGMHHPRRRLYGATRMTARASTPLASARDWLAYWLTICSAERRLAAAYAAPEVVHDHKRNAYAALHMARSFNAELS